VQCTSALKGFTLLAPISVVPFVESCPARTLEIVNMNLQNWLSTIQGAGIERKLAAGQMLYGQGDPAIGLYEVVSGRVRQLRVDAEGRDVVVGIACAGDMIAEGALFSPIHDCAATAVTKAVVRLYRKARLLAEFERNPDASLAFMAMLFGQILNLRVRLERRSIQSARDRVLHYLSANAGGKEQAVALPSTVKDLAAELGLTHEALYRTLSAMTASGEIARFNGKICLLAPL
jgi:CRP/FNR family transcriptional regulator, dissimilatory nitrate respiration regulator